MKQTPVTVITGFLGSGKTTLIARLLRQPGLANTAVIVNEFGEVGLDHFLVERLDGDVVLLPQGCVCCMLNGTVGATLEGLDSRRLTGQVPMFDHVIIETTGLANPAPVLQALLGRGVMLRGFTPGLIVTTVDAAHGSGTLLRHPEAVQQVAIADRLLLTKPDLETGPALREQLDELNPYAPILPVLHGDIDLRELTPGSSADLALLPAGRRVRGFAATSGHTSRITTLSLRLAEAVDFVDLADFLGTLAAEHGEALLRVKGIVRIRGEARPLAVHGVQHVFHPPTRMAVWPPGLEHPTLVLILDAVEPLQVQSMAEEFGLLPKSSNL